MNSDEFAEWWFESGSGIVPLVDEDAHEHARRVAEAAWQHRQAKIDRMRGVAVSFGRHLDSCDFHRHDYGGCSCGFIKALTGKEGKS